MGQYFIVVNPEKKQFIDASRFNENIKASGVLSGFHANCVALLVCNLEQVRSYSGKLMHHYGQLAGSWCGDSILMAGDDGKEDEFGIQTSSQQNPNRNLYFMAQEEFEDISYKALAMLCNGNEEIAQEIAQSASASLIRERELVNLGNVVLQIGCKTLERALIKEYGAEWQSLHKKAAEDRW